MKHILFLLIAFAFSVQIYSVELRGKVMSVSDGDTLTLKTEDSKFKIRLSDIDAPEKKQSGGEDAKSFLKKIAEGRQVIINYNSLDRYKRVIGTIYIEDVNINLVMVCAGHAWHYKKFSKNEVFATAEVAARSAEIGLWAEENPVPPWEYRKSLKKVQHKSPDNHSR